MKRVLYLGEGQGVGGYLGGVLLTAYEVDRALSHTLDPYALVVLSDFPADRFSLEQQQDLARAVETRGLGLWMVGGWGSFSGPAAGYRGTPVGDLLPVECADGDDRVNTPLGTILTPADPAHPAIRSVSQAEPCCVVGYNRVKGRSGAHVLLHGQHLRIGQGSPAKSEMVSSAEGTRLSVRTSLTIRGPRLERAETPMLSVWERGRGRVAAFAPDLSPHWAGGIVDWGEERLTLPSGHQIGHLYRAFILDLCAWLEGERA